MHTPTPTHADSELKLFCSAMERLSALGGGRVGAAACEMEALMSPKASAKAEGETAQ